MIVSNYEEWKNRQDYLEEILEKKRKQIKDLKLEVFTLQYALNYWKTFSKWE